MCDYGSTELIEQSKCLSEKLPRLWDAPSLSHSTVRNSLVIQEYVGEVAGILLMLSTGQESQSEVQTREDIGQDQIQSGHEWERGWGKGMAAATLGIK